MEFRSVHPVQVREITPLSAWLLSRLVIGAVFVCTFAPFVYYYWRG